MITGSIVYGSQPPFLLTVIYASNTFEGRTLLWDDIRKVNPGNSLPWVVMGDFNCCRYQNEKIGGNDIAASRLAPFNSLIFDANLTDVPSFGNLYTWFNQRVDNPIYSKLDRILANDMWFEEFPNSSYNVLNSLTSDHCPLILKMNIGKRNYQKFMYKNYWCKCPDFWESLISVFAIPTVGNPIISLYDKLHHLKDIIKGKSCNSFDSIKRKCDDLSLQQQKIQLSSNQDLLSTAICEELKKVNTELVFYNSLRMYNSASPLPCWLKTRYSSPWKVGHRNVTPFWKSICSTANHVKHKFKFQISKNSPIAVFWDHWCSNNTLTASFPALLYSNCNTNSVLGDWMHLTDWVLPPNLSNQIIEFITAIPISSNGNKHILWNNLGKVTFKDFYLDYYANDSSVDWHKLVWHKKFALRYSAYSWLAFSGGLKTVDALLKRNINIVDLWCPLCHDSYETKNHLFFECLFSFNVLSRLMPTFHNFLLHPNIYQAFDHISALEDNLKVINDTLLLLNATVYFLWLERNNRRFNSKYLCAISLAKQISRAVYLKLDKWKDGKEIKSKLNLKF
ncbi:hypothetical protein M5K25_008944 [Dendrobium thyrsiflorum]|uniref:Reverse transcriptase zinc-binding domain-containing protein n=1 Tax=Dendrobium thyrsiflorum TaxID=117978 RepID=A0ABD0VH44_DENTH